MQVREGGNKNKPLGSTPEMEVCEGVAGEWRRKLLYSQLLSSALQCSARRGIYIGQRQSRYGSSQVGGGRAESWGMQRQMKKRGKREAAVASKSHERNGEMGHGCLVSPKPGERVYIYNIEFVDTIYAMPEGGEWKEGVLPVAHGTASYAKGLWCLE